MIFTSTILSRRALAIHVHKVDIDLIIFSLYLPFERKLIFKHVRLYLNNTIYCYQNNNYVLFSSMFPFNKNQADSKELSESNTMCLFISVVHQYRFGLMQIVLHSHLHLKPESAGLRASPLVSNNVEVRQIFLIIWNTGSE